MINPSIIEACLQSVLVEKNIEKDLIHHSKGDGLGE